MRTLIVAPHLDDESISCGGLIAKRVRMGYDVRVIAMFGRRYSGEDEKHSYRDEYDDFTDACQKLDRGLGRLTWAGYCLPEGEPHKVGYYGLLDRLESELKNYNPYEVIGPAKDDLNQDHRHLYEVLGIALRSYALWPRFNSWKSFHALDGKPKTPNVFEVLQSVDLDLKIAAVESYRRERRPDPHPRSAGNIAALARVTGSLCGAELAEGYTLELHRLL